MPSCSWVVTKGHMEGDAYIPDQQCGKKIEYEMVRKPDGTRERKYKDYCPEHLDLLARQHSTPEIPISCDPAPLVVEKPEPMVQVETNLKPIPESIPQPSFRKEDTSSVVLEPKSSHPADPPEIRRSDFRRQRFAPTIISSSGIIQVNTPLRPDQYRPDLVMHEDEEQDDAHFKY